MTIPDRTELVRRAFTREVMREADAAARAAVGGKDPFTPVLGPGEAQAASDAFLDVLARVAADALAEPPPQDGDAAMLQLIDERDYAEGWADELAYALFTVEEIGEHSNLNNPWANALELFEERLKPEAPRPSASPATQEK